MVISSRTTGTTVFRPSSSSMISFINDSTGCGGRIYRNPEDPPKHHFPMKVWTWSQSLLQ